MSELKFSYSYCHYANSRSSAPVASSPAPAPVEAPAEPTTTTTAVGPQPIKVLRSQIDADRVRRLGERFKIHIDPKDFTPARAEKETYRVEKPIRMRIHRKCHVCNTAFGANRTCPSCQHEKCSQCPRYPPRKPRTRTERKDPEVPVKTGHEIEVDNYYGIREPFVLTRPSKTGGQPLVRKTPKQRVRRTCHQCSALFPPGSKICASCDHVRCTDCPRDP